MHVPIHESLQTSQKIGTVSIGGVHMLDRLGRSIKDSILNPLERTITRSLSHNAITWISLIPGLATAAFAAAGWWGWAIGAFAVNRILDGMDGIVARRRGMQSDYGGYL